MSLVFFSFAIRVGNGNDRGYGKWILGHGRLHILITRYMCCVSMYVTRERGHLRANSCLAWVIKFHDLGAWLLIIENDVLVFYLYQIHTYIVTFFFLVQSIIVHDTRVMESIYNCFGFAICSIYVHKNIGILLLEVSNDHKHFYYVMIYI